MSAVGIANTPATTSTTSATTTSPSSLATSSTTTTTTTTTTTSITSGSSKSALNKTVHKESKKSQGISKNVGEKQPQTDSQTNADVKLQPTAEQMRLANLMNDKIDFSELQTKVEKIMELTGSSRDDAVVALHDCDHNLEKAVNMILEGDPINESEWRSSGKKKKSKVTAAAQQSQADNEDASKLAVNGEKLRGSGRGKGGPRLQRGAKSRTRDDKPGFGSNENAPPDDGNFNSNPSRRMDNKRGKGRGGSRGSSRGGRGTRTFQNRGYRSIPNDTFPNSIDTWTNSTADQSSTPAVNNDCTTMTVGNWSDIAGNEDLSEEDWDSSLMETKVFTPSAKALSEKDELSEIANANVPNSGQTSQNISLSLLHKAGTETSSQQQQQQHQPQTQPMSNIIGAGNTNTSRSSTGASPGAVLLQQLQQQSAAASQQPSQMNHYSSLSQFSKQATESIKSLVGIPSSSYTATGSSSLLTGGSSVDNQGTSISRGSQPPSHNDQTVSSLVSTKPPPTTSRMPAKRPTKIPESAVEMPSNDSISSLNVQFGALEFGTDSSFSLRAEPSDAFHDVVNHVNPKDVKPVVSGTSAGASSTLNSTSLLSDSTYRSGTNQTDNSTAKAQTSSADIVLQNTVLRSSNMAPDAVLERSGKNSSAVSYGPKVLESTHNKSSLYSSGSSHVQPQGSIPCDTSAYKSTPYNVQPDVSSVYGSNVNYGVTNAYAYPSTTAQVGGYSSVSNYSSNFSGATNVPHTGAPTTKAGLKDLDNVNSQQKHSYDIQSAAAAAAAAAGANLGMVSNSTVTTNVLKNSLTASKGIPNVTPGVAPLLGTQYIMGQAGLPFYPLYDVQIPAAREPNFAYTGASDVKYSRADNDGTSVVSTQAPVSQTHTQPIFGQLPPGYGFFYTPGAVNMMPQSLYGAAAPLFPVTPAANTHGGSAGSGFPKGTTAYGSHSYASTGYDSLAPVPQQDFVKQAYGPTGGQQSKGMSASNAGDLAGNQMYGKSHAQLTKSYEKAGFQTGTPPPFNMPGGQPGALGGSYATTPSQYIQMLPQSQPSMLHHSLQGDGSQTGTSGVGGPRSMSQSQKGSGSSSSKYYNNWA